MNGINPYITLVGPCAIPGLSPAAIFNTAARTQELPVIEASQLATIPAGRPLSITAMTLPARESSMIFPAAAILAPVVGALFMSGCGKIDSKLRNADVETTFLAIGVMLVAVGGAILIGRGINRGVARMQEFYANMRMNKLAEKTRSLIINGEIDEAERLLSKVPAGNMTHPWEVPFAKAYIKIMKGLKQEDARQKHAIMSSAVDDLSQAADCVKNSLDQWPAENCCYLLQLLKAFYCGDSGINLPKEIYGEEMSVELAYLLNYAHDLPGKWINMDKPPDELNTFLKFISNFLGLPMGTDIEVSYAKEVIGKNPVFGPFMKKLKAIANRTPYPVAADHCMKAALEALKLPDGKGNLDAACLFRMAMVEYAYFGNNEQAEAAALRAHWLERPERSIDSPVQFLAGRVKITIRDVDMNPAENRKLLQKLYVAADLFTERTDSWFEYLELMGIGPAKNEAEYLKNAELVENTIKEIISWFASRVGYEGNNPPLFWSRSQIEWKARRGLKDKGIPMTEEFKTKLAALAASRPVL